MVRCCEDSDSEEDSLLDPASYRKSYREVERARQRDNPAWLRISERAYDDPNVQTAMKNSVLDGVYAGLTGSIGLTPLANPYSPQQVALRSAGVFSVSLPQNIYSAAISAVLNLGHESMLLGARDIPVFVGAFVSLILQCGLSFYIAWFQFDDAVELGSCRLGGKVFIRVSCILVFCMYIFGELNELIDTHFWLNMFRYAHRHKPLEIREYEHVTGTLVNKPVTGMTYLERFSLYILILMPKTIMAFALLVFGVPYIAYAQTNDSLLLNTVVLILVAEIDEIVFRFAIPKMYRETLLVPQLGRTETERSRCFEMVVCGTVRPYVMFFLLASIAALLYAFWCQN